jgi:hypothetical protein
MGDLNIVELIENNPITKLNETYNVKLLAKIKSNFTEFEQQLFITSFYCYLNYDKTADFIIDMDNVWKWLGFSSKQNAIKLLEKFFKVNEDYNNLVLNLADKHKKSNDGGHNIKKFMLNIRCFKSLCLKAQTKKASQIHEYYMKMEEIVQEVIDEESTELRLQIEEQTKKLAINEIQITSHKRELENVDKDKNLLREKTLLTQFPDNVQCIYFGLIDNKSIKQEPLIKFGCSNFLSDRVKCHKTTYNNFRLMGAFRVCNKTQIENAIKIHPILIKQQRKLKIKQTTHIELLSIHKFPIFDIEKIIIDIIQNIEFTPDNYSKLLEENDHLKREIEELKRNTPENYNNMIVENARLIREHIILREKTEDETRTKLNVFNKLIKEKNILYNTLIQRTEPSNFIPTLHNAPLVSIKTHNPTLNDRMHSKTAISKIMVRCDRQPDGLYYVDEGVYPILMGSRQEVWDGVAYKTAGGLIKSQLTIGVEGNIVSKSKSITASADNRLMTYMLKVGKVIPNTTI